MKQTMKQVDILTSLPLNSTIGPVQTIKRLLNSKDLFSERGFELNVFTRETGSTSVHKSKIKRIKKIPIIGTLFDFSVKWLSKHTLFWRKKTFANYDKCAIDMLEKYKKLGRKPDVIVFHHFADCYHYLSEYKIEGTKVVFFQHDDGSGTMGLSVYPKMKGSNVEKKHNERMQYIMENIDVKACITKITQKNLLERYPCLKGKTCLVVNGISDLTVEQLNESEVIRNNNTTPKYRLICTGSMNGRKGQREIIEALHMTRPEIMKEIKVLFLGDGWERRSLEKLVSKYNLTRNVVFQGTVPNSEVYKFQAMSNISILISKVEGLPLSLLEGMRNKLALISTNVSGIPEIIESNVNGLLINPDVNELLNVFNNMDNYNWQKMGEESRKKFEVYYNFPRMRDDYIKMLNHVLEC